MMINLENNSEQGIKEINKELQETALEKTRDKRAKGSLEDQKETDTISSLLLERDQRPLHPQAVSTDTLNPALETKPDLFKEDALDRRQTQPKPSDSSPEAEAFHSETEKVKKELESTKRWGHANSQKLKRALVQTKAFIENGDLSEEEGDRLLDILQSSVASGDEESNLGDDKNPNPFVKIFKIANSELENIRKYTDDPLLQEKINAFDYFIAVMASSSEREELLEAFNELIDQPIHLTKKLLNIGKTVYEESYRDIQEAGGLKSYLVKKDAQIEKLTKTIDKLSKKLSQYEDYDRPTYGLSEMGSSEEKSHPPIDTITGLFAERDRPIMRR